MRECEIRTLCREDQESRRPRGDEERKGRRRERSSERGKMREKTRKMRGWTSRQGVKGKSGEGVLDVSIRPGAVRFSTGKVATV